MCVCEGEPVQTGRALRVCMRVGVYVCMSKCAHVSMRPVCVYM